MPAENPPVPPSVRDSRTFLRSSAAGQPRPPSATAINSEKPPSRSLIWAIHHPATGAPSHLQGQSHQPGPLSLPGGAQESPVSDPCPWTRSHEVFGHQPVTGRRHGPLTQASDAAAPPLDAWTAASAEGGSRRVCPTRARPRALLCGGLVPTQQRPRRWRREDDERPLNENEEGRSCRARARTWTCTLMKKMRENASKPSSILYESDL